GVRIDRAPATHGEAPRGECMTTETIRSAARAAYERYFFGRPGYAWITAGNATQIRFELMAARVLNGEYTEAKQLHAFYNQDHADPIGWSEISTKTRMRWNGALFAIQRTGVLSQEAA